MVIINSGFDPLHYKWSQNLGEGKGIRIWGINWLHSELETRMWNVQFWLNGKQISTPFSLPSTPGTTPPWSHNVVNCKQAEWREKWGIVLKLERE